MEGSDRGPYTGNSTRLDLVVSSRAQGWEQRERCGLFQAEFHLSVVEGHQKQGCGLESGQGDREKQAQECCALLVSVEDTRLLQNQSEPHPTTWHTRKAVCLLFFELNSAQAATCQLSRKFNTFHLWLPANVLALSKTPHILSSVSKASPLWFWSHKAKLRPMPLELKETTATPRTQMLQI